MADDRVTRGPVAPRRAYGVGPNQYAPGCLIALSTFRDSLHLVVKGQGAASRGGRLPARPGRCVAVIRTRAILGPVSKDLTGLGREAGEAWPPMPDTFL